MKVPMASTIYDRGIQHARQYIPILVGNPELQTA
jgi:hypothetical protein